MTIKLSKKKGVSLPVSAVSESYDFIDSLPNFYFLLLIVHVNYMRSFTCHNFHL